MKIALTGSLGNISKPMAISLIGKKHEVTIISNSPSRADEIIQLGATPAIGDIFDADFLTRIFTGMDIVYTMIPPDFSAADPIGRYVQIGESFAAALQHSGAKRVVHLSSWGADQPSGTGFIVGSHLVEEIFNKLQGISFAYLRPTSFYYNLFAYIDMIKYTGSIATNYGEDDKLVMVAPEDIAEAAVQDMEMSPVPKKIRYVASDERNCNEIAAVLGQAIGIPTLTWKRLSDDETLSILQTHGMPEHIAAKLVELNAGIRTGHISGDYYRNRPAETGRTKLEDFAKRFAQVFHSK